MDTKSWVWEYSLKFERDHERIVGAACARLTNYDVIEDHEANVLNAVEDWLRSSDDGLALRQTLGPLFAELAERLEAAERGVS